MIMGAYRTEEIFTNNDSTLTNETVTILKASLSRHGNAILQALYESPGMQQKSLAATIHTSPASLSNIISKLETIQPQLLQSERTGRSKFYSLTDTAAAYVESELLHKEKPVSPKIHPFNASSYEDALIDETLHFLTRFQHAAGSEWYMVLDDLLCGFHENKISDEVYDRYMDFTDSLVQLRIKQKTAATRKIYDAVDNIILAKRLDRYLNSELKDLFILEPLFDLEKQDFEQACALIDNIFYKLRPNIFCQAEPVALETLSITQDQYFAIYHQISEMINEFSKFNGNKTAAVTFWKDRFHSYNASLRYIASNCYVIYADEH